MSIETGVVVRYDGFPFYWHLPEGRNSAYLPDSHYLWEILWNNRHDILGFAHSHPGGGVPGPSGIDITTFEAIEKALGRELVWWITSSEATVVVRKYGKHGDWVTTRVLNEEGFRWLPKLRRVSYGNGDERKRLTNEHDEWLQQAISCVIREKQMGDINSAKMSVNRIAILAPTVDVGREFVELSNGLIQLMEGAA
jgi:proteasome lid subunit RPN8/RPN11